MSPIIRSDALGARRITPVVDAVNTHHLGEAMSKSLNACGKHRPVATVSVPTRRHTMRKSFVALAGLGVAGLLTAGAAQASVLPSHSSHVVRPPAKTAPAKVVPVNTSHALFVFPRDVADYESAGYTCVVVRTYWGKPTLYSCSLGG